MPGTFRGVKDSHGAWQSADGQPSNGSFGHHARSGSVDSLDSNSGSSVSSTGHARQLSGEGTEFIPTRTVAKIPTLPAHNPLQFVKVQTSPLYRKAEEQIKLTKTVKITREKLKEEEETWQLNLDDWKSRRRKQSEKLIQRQEEMRKIEAEEQMRQLQGQKKGKTFSEMIEERSQRKKSYNLALYHDEDNRASGTSETEEQGSSSVDIQHLSTRSDASDAASEAESVPESLDSDTRSSDRVGEQEGDVLQESVPFTQVSGYRLDSSVDEFQSQKIESHEENYTQLHPLREVSKMEHSSAEPSDIEAAPGEFEPVSSEEDGGCCTGVGNNDSGLESLCGSHRAGRDPDSASDFSQDSCSGLDKSTLEVECEISSEKEASAINNYQQDVDERSITLDSRNDAHFVKRDDGEEFSLMIQVKSGGDAKSFGFTLKGGSDQGLPVLVESVVPGSLSDHAGLRVGDEILAINGESTSGCSHASLVFSVKQAMYTEQLNLIVFRPDTASAPGLSTHQHDRKQLPKPTKRGSAFAQKIAMFNTSTAENPTSVQLRKTPRAQEAKGDSLVLRRRSAFENSSLNREQTMNNRRSLSLLQDSKSIDKSVSNERRHSMGYSNEPDESENIASDESITIVKKPPPPPIPVKPKLLQKPASELQERSSCMPLQSSIVPECPTKSSLSVNDNSSDSNELIKDEQLTAVESVSTISNTKNDTKHVKNLVSETFLCDSPSHSNDGDNTNQFNELEIGVHYLALDSEEKSVDMSEFSEWNITDEENTEVLPHCSQNYIFPVIDEEKELNTNRLENNLNNILEMAMTDDVNEIGNLDAFSFRRNEVPIADDNSAQSNDRTFFEEAPPSDFVERSEVQLILETSAISIDSNIEIQYDNAQDDGAKSYVGDTRVEYDAVETSDLPQDIHGDGSPELCCPDDALNDEGVSEEIISEFSEDNITVLEMQKEDLDKSENYLSDLENDSETERNLDDEGTPLPPVDLESPSMDIEGSEMRLTDEIVSSQAEIKLTNDEHLLNIKVEAASNEPEMLQLEISKEVESDETDKISIHNIEEQTLELLEDSSFQDEMSFAYHVDDSGLLLDDLETPCHLEPPKEKPPPPPPPLEMEVLENKPPSFIRVNSTKRIKKEIKKRRSDFLGLDPSAADDLDIIPPRPPLMEEILKSEQELAREQRQWLENRLSLPDQCILKDLDVETSEVYTDSIDGGETDGSIFLHDQKEVESTASDYGAPLEDEVTNGSDNIELSDLPEGLVDAIEEKLVELPQTERAKEPDTSPQAIARQNIFSLGAAPKAKIMDSSKWIKHSDKSPTKKTPDLIFFDGNYTTHIFSPQKQQQKTTTSNNAECKLHLSPERKPPHNRYSMPTFSSRYPDVTVRTWREREYSSQKKPRSHTHPDLLSVASSLDNAKHDRSHSAPAENWYSDSVRHSDSSESNFESHYHSLNDSEKKICVSHKNKCAHCSEELVHGAAMGIEALQLYYHIQCFTCCACKTELGNGLHGTDVQVWNKSLYCQKCFACIDISDEANGI